MNKESYNLKKIKKQIHSFNNYFRRAFFPIIFLGLLLISSKVLPQCIPQLGAAKSFAVLAGSTITSAVAGVVTGDIGVSPGTAVTGFPPALVQNGQIYTGAASLAGLAQASALNAYNEWLTYQNASTIDLTGIILGETPGYLALNPGIYSFSTSAQLNATLTLNDGGDSNAIFIFKMGSTLTSASNAAVIMSSGGKGNNVYWLVGSSATIGTSTNLCGNIIAVTSITLNTNSIIHGRAFALNGAVTLNTLDVSRPTYVSNSMFWTGAATTTNWKDAANWQTNLVPAALDDIVIPNGIPIYPIVSDINSLHDIIIQNAASVIVTGGSLKISGSICNAGTFDIREGTIETNGTLPQTFPANTFVNNTMLNLIVSNDLYLEGQQNITGAVSFGSTNKTFYTAGLLTLKSAATGTAKLDNTTGNYISGEITIERYMLARRAWHLLSAPLSSTGTPTINAAWQEGVTSGNPNPGYGVQITGGTVSNGYDQGINFNPSLKIYNSSNNSFEGLPTIPGTIAPINTYPGYFLFVRGDRSTNLLQGVNAPLTPTVLRMKGMVNTGDIQMNINALGLSLIGNPYPSPIDFHSLTKNNVKDEFYCWDQLLAGTYGVGGYVTLIWNGTNGYDATTSVSLVSGIIPSGLAILVEAVDSLSPGIITINETNKSTGGNDYATRQPIGNEKVRINLFTVNADGSKFLSDGVLTTYGNNNANIIDQYDAAKIYNPSDNISIVSDGKALAIERRKTIDVDDTTYLQLSLLKAQNYMLQITTEALKTSGLYAVVKDAYANYNSLVNMDGLTSISFTINSDPASYASNRFSIVFAKQVSLPVRFIDIKAHRIQNNILVEWKTAREFGIKNYEVEKSYSGIQFDKVASFSSKESPDGFSQYSWLDMNVPNAIHFYRIKAISLAGIETYSKVVKLEDREPVEGITVYPNPTINGIVNLQINAATTGQYKIRLMNSVGNILLIKNIHHLSGVSNEKILLPKGIAKGIYRLEITKPDRSKFAIDLFSQ